MIFCEWQDTYSLNISNIDAHHQKLFELVNSLYANVFQCKVTSQKQLLIRKTFTELVDYTYYHFSQEEELLFKCEYPGYEAHKMEHEQFKLSLVQLMKDYEDETFVWALPLLNFLRDWIQLHIRTTDKQYGLYINERNLK